MSSFVPAGSLLMSAVARGRFGVLSSPRDAHSSQMESREGHGERPPLSPGAGLGAGPAPSGQDMATCPLAGLVERS